MKTINPSQEAEYYHYHPLVEERIAALKNLVIRDHEKGNDSGRVAMADFRDIERRLIKQKYGADFYENLTSIEWDHVASEAHLPFWEEISRSNLSALTGITVTDIPKLSYEIGNLDKSMEIAPSPQGDENITEFLEFIVGSSLSVVLVRAGFELVPMTMHNPTFSRGDATVKPFTLVKDLRERVIPADKWTSMADKLGIGDLPLAFDI